MGRRELDSKNVGDFRNFGGEVEIPVDASIAAFSKLIVSHHESLYRAALVLTGGRHADADDLTQQTLLKAYQKRDQLREPGAAKRWLLVIARSIFLKGLHKKSAKLWSQLDAVDDERQPSLESSITDRHGDEPNTIDYPIDPADLPQLLTRLDDGQRLILHLYYFEDLSYREIAEMMQVKIGTVMSRLARAKQRLRELAQVGHE